MFVRINTHERRLSIDGTCNFRDIGGYRSSGRQSTCWGKLYRSDKLDHLSEIGQRQLGALNIHAIFDLRYTPEVIDAPDVIVADRAYGYQHVPLYELDGIEKLPTVPDSARDLYVKVIDHRREQIKFIFDQMAAKTANPMLFHCTAGKDRTGIVIALVLGAIGVASDTIVEDYAASALYIQPVLDDLRLLARVSGWDTEWYERLLSTDPANMSYMLDHIDRVYGGIDSYLLGSGITRPTLERIRSWLLE